MLFSLAMLGACGSIMPPSNRISLCLTSPLGCAGALALRSLRAGDRSASARFDGFARLAAGFEGTMVVSTRPLDLAGGGPAGGTPGVSKEKGMAPWLGAISVVTPRAVEGPLAAGAFNTSAEA